MSLRLDRDGRRRAASAPARTRRPGPGPQRPSRSYDYEGTATEVADDPPELPAAESRDG